LKDTLFFFFGKEKEKCGQGTPAVGYAKSLRCGAIPRLDILEGLFISFKFTHFIFPLFFTGAFSESHLKNLFRFAFRIGQPAVHVTVGTEHDVRLLKAVGQYLLNVPCF
jgi:hypothetical protein